MTAKESVKDSFSSLMVSSVAVSMTEAVLLEGLKLKTSLERVRSTEKGTHTLYIGVYKDASVQWLHATSGDYCTATKILFQSTIVL